mgnify:CR=1 FL=1
MVFLCAPGVLKNVLNDLAENAVYSKLQLVMFIIDN